jgi:actin-related protein
MNISVKKQILLILGLVCLLQPNLFAMVKKEAAVQRELNKKSPNFVEVNRLISELPEGANKKHYQDKALTMQRTKAPAAPAAYVAKPVKFTVSKTAAKQAEKSAALHTFNQAKNIADKLVADAPQADFTKASNNSDARFDKAGWQSLAKGSYQDFAEKIARVIELRAAKTDPAASQESLDAIKAAFDAGKELFFTEVSKLFEVKDVTPEIYNPFKKAADIAIAADPATTINLRSALTSIDPSSAALMISTDMYHDSALIEILRAEQILWKMFQADWKAKARNNPWPNYQNAVWDQMEADLELMRTIAIASFHLIGARLGADKEMTANWADAKGMDRLFFGGKGMQSGSVYDVEQSIYKNGRSKDGLLNKYKTERWAQELDKAIQEFRTPAPAPAP